MYKFTYLKEKFGYEEITAEILSEFLKYDPETGKFYWPERGPLHRFGFDGTQGGAETGITNGVGYREVKVACERIPAHRLAFFLYYGRWPKAVVDHINGDPLDNRIVNLREASYAENNMNACLSSRNTSGFRGISQNKRGRYDAYINFEGQRMRKTFSTLEDAVKWRNEWEVKLYRDFAKIDRK